eukprot:355651-Prorocentrum_minimum.AAC.9
MFGNSSTGAYSPSTNPSTTSVFVAGLDVCVHSMYFVSLSAGSRGSVDPVGQQTITVLQIEQTTKVYIKIVFV